MWFLWLCLFIKAFKLLQACLLGSLRALSRTFLLQQLYRLQQAVSTLCESLQLLFEDRECVMLLEGKVEMFSQLRSR